MKFKAVVENDGGVGSHQQTILHVLQAFQKLERVADRRTAGRGGGAPGGHLILKLAPEHFSFCHRAGPDEESQTWSHFHIKKLFREYRIESKRQNCIDLEVAISSLVHVFTNGASSERMLIRLAATPDGRSVLNFEFTMAGNSIDHRVEQEVPIRVIPHEEAEGILEPQMPEPEYQLELPRSLTRFKGVLDKMRHVNVQHLTVEAGLEEMMPGLTGAEQPRATGTQEPDRGLGSSGPGVGATAAMPPSCGGEGMSAPRRESGSGKAWLRLEAKTEVVNISSIFPSLGVVSEGKDKPPPDHPVKLPLQLKRLGEVIAAFQLVSAQGHIACLLEDKALVLFTRLPQGFGSLISYSPVIDQ